MRIVITVNKVNEVQAPFLCNFKKPLTYLIFFHSFLFFYIENLLMHCDNIDLRNIMDFSYVRTYSYTAAYIQS
jgi:hypothetical protein